MRAHSDPPSGNVRWSIAYWIALLSVLGLAICGEVSRRWGDESGVTPDWWSGLSPDWLPFLPILLLGIPAWLIRRDLLDGVPGWLRHLQRWGSETCPTAAAPATASGTRRAILCSLVVAATGLGMSGYIGSQFGDLPPAYHDEYSYLFQTETFLAGRVWFPSHATMPELFDQMHVLNEGHFASRYFPGTGLWMMPFVELGHPWWGHRLAHCCCAFLLFWIGRHLANNAVGLLAGLLLAVSPGVALFSNLLLAHHPALVGLLVFVITFLKLRQAISEGTGAWLWALLSGTGLTFAMLCRPMTAAGVGLPFGLWFAWWLTTGRQPSPAGQSRPSPRYRLLTATALTMPIVTGLIGLFVYNRAITGDGFVTPYQQYTDIYTPRHVYGFNNVVRGEQHLGPKVLQNYDEWAENLTPALAVQNVVRRIRSSLIWTLGIVPLVWAGMIFVLTIDRWSHDWWLIAAAIVSLHVVHIPYWFEGIMGWHYVFESAPFWLLVFAGVSQRMLQHWSTAGRGLMPLWWCGLLGTSLLVNHITVPPLWPARRDLGVGEVAFSRLKYAAFDEQVAQITQGRRSLVLIAADPADRHIDYVVNSPALNATVLFGRYRPEQTHLEAVVHTFADRDVWLIDIAAHTVERVSKATE